LIGICYVLFLKNTLKFFETLYFVSQSLLSNYTWKIFLWKLVFKKYENCVGTFAVLIIKNSAKTYTFRWGYTVASQKSSRCCFLIKYWKKIFRRRHAYIISIYLYAQIIPIIYISQNPTWFQFCNRNFSIIDVIVTSEHRILY
jgi:hypothetical protein